MGMTKYASLESAEILDIKGSSDAVENPTFEKLADFGDYKTDDGYLYTRVRAISSRVNKNMDGWPSEELANSYQTFLNKPIFVDHHNSDPTKARGVIVDAKLHIEDDLEKASAFDAYYSSAPENHKPPTWIELLLEVDAKSFPHLAKAIIAGDIDGVSMGSDVEKSICNICSNVASSPKEYCEHVQNKGALYTVEDDYGNHMSKKSYEDCHGIRFFEISYVFDPADETALVHEVRTAALVHAEAGDLEGLTPEERRAWQEWQQKSEQFAPTADEIRGLPETDVNDSGNMPMPNVQDEANSALAEEDPSIAWKQRQDAFHQQKMQENPQYADAQADRLQGTMDQTLDQIQGLPDLRDKFHQYLQQKGITPDADDLNYSHTRESVLIPGDIHGEGFGDGNQAYTCAACGANVGLDERSVPGLHRAKSGHDFVPLVSNQGANTSYMPTQVPTLAHCSSCGSDMEGSVCALGHKTAENIPPLSDFPHAPTPVNTLRQEKICPVCGSDTEDGHCSVCNYEEPPDGFGNPDLDKAKQVQENEMSQAPPAPPPDMGGGAPPGGAPMGAPGPAPGGAPQGQMMAASTTKNMHPQDITNRTAAKTPNTIQRPILPATRKPSDLPTTTKVVKDQSRPVESNTNDKRNRMNYTKAQVEGFAHKLVMDNEYPDYNSAFAAVTSALTKKAEGATPPDGDVAADQRVNVQDVGGFDDVTPQNFAEKTVDVEGVGAVDPNAEAGTEHQDVTKAVDTANSGPTDTWSDNKANGHEQASPVSPETGDFFSGPAKRSNLFPDDDNFGKQIDLEKELAPDGMVGERTDTWSDNKANGHEQADPVTTEVFPGIDVHSAIEKAAKASRNHLLKSIRTAETEIELGLTEPEEKWNRVDELDQKTPDELQAYLDSYASVKKAGIRRPKQASLKAPRLGGAPKDETSVIDHQLEDAMIFNR